MIVISYGRDVEKSTYGALEASDIRSHLKQGMEVAIKPNLVVPGPASNGATTHPEVVEGIIRFIKDFGINNIKVIESSWVGDCTKRAFKYCNYEGLARKYGIPLIDLKDDSTTRLTHGGMNIDICNEALKTDFLINVPVLKAHCQTRLTCCMKNLKGCIPDSEKRRFHTLGLHKPIAVLNTLLKTGYCVVDGICGDLSFEEGGNPVESNRVIVGQNPLTVDSCCAELIGYKPDEIGYIAYGKELGIGEYYSEKTGLVELDAQKKPVRVPDAGRSAERYAELIEEDAACSACFASLVFALNKLGKPRFNGKIHIGQGFAGKGGDGIGVGDCASGYVNCAKGCPPKATDILDMLSSVLPMTM